MTSEIALACAVEPSATSLPEGQLWPDALLLPAAPPFASAAVGSEPQAARPNAVSEAVAATAAIRDPPRRLVIMPVLIELGGTCPRCLSACGEAPALTDRN